MNASGRCRKKYTLGKPNCDMERVQAFERVVDLEAMRGFWLFAGSCSEGVAGVQSDIS